MKKYLSSKNMHAEMLDIVNENDEIIAVESRDTFVEGEGRYCRTINAFIKNKDGKLWFPRRTEKKKRFPLCLDMSVGGYVMSGETYEDCFFREAQEETGLDLQEIPWHELAYLNPAKVAISSFMKVFEIEYDETPDYNPDDFCESEWLTPEEFVERADAGEKLKGDLRALVEMLYLDI